MQEGAAEQKQDEVQKALLNVLTEIDEVETTLQQMQDPQEMLKKTSMDLASTIDQISSLLLDRFQMKQDVEQIAENLAALEALKQDLEDSLAKWKKRKLPALAENYLTQAKMSKQQSEKIRKQAEESQVKLNLDVELLVNHILKKEVKKEEEKDNSADEYRKAYDRTRANQEKEIMEMKCELQAMTEQMKMEQLQLMKVTEELENKEQQLKHEMDDVNCKNDMMNEEIRCLENELDALKKQLSEKKKN